MARIRTVKPEFFRHEKLQDLETENPGKYPMLVFEGLWIVCDSQGVFKWRPRHLKLDILPFLNFDMEETLEILRSSGMIVKFEAEEKQYGLVPTFRKYQRLTGKEAQDGKLYPFPTDYKKASENQQGSIGETSGKQQGSNCESPVAQEKEKEKEKEKERSRKKPKTSLPENFKISDRVKEWADKKGFVNLEDHLESFVLKCKSKDYQYVDWDDAFMNAVRDNWAKIENNSHPTQSREPPSLVVSCPACGNRVTKSDLVEDGCVNCKYGKSK